MLINKTVMLNLWNMINCKQIIMAVSKGPKFGSMKEKIGDPNSHDTASLRI